MEHNTDKLEKLMGRNPFRAPDGYFENFADKMMNRLPEKQAFRPKGEKISLFERMRPWLAVAAVFIGLITVFFVFENKRDNMYAYKNMIVRNISMQTVAGIDADSNAEADFFDYISDEYSRDNAEEFMDNLIN
ncbi:MAG: hypothetical protein LBE91_06670 [Tannerella sp.]|nr:hypothetical protein [Tannerella sp.]